MTFRHTLQRDGRIGIVIGVARILELPDRFYEVEQREKGGGKREIGVVYNEINDVNSEWQNRSGKRVNKGEIEKSIK